MPEITCLVILRVRDVRNTRSRAGLYRFLIRETIDVGRVKAQIIDHRLHYGHFITTKRRWK
ncbi:hypothetical protein PITCH_A220016 [uncultured Desulfobacterium sp.]|uniref:Uncharacterized protein n=1 Tax=uncultured Desulfobacterium sp. TaxID=201089 RepID=A0A445MXV6_9BACT|nr:hypothetical protein PITCH_A220016 [uncultured Desulfobacterium sp.]